MAEHPKWIHALLRQAASRAKARQLPFDFTADDVSALWSDQKGLCYWFKVPMGMGVERNTLDLPTLDRVSSDGGYVRGNVVLSCLAANRAKGDSDPDVWEDFLKTLSYWNRQEEKSEEDSPEDEFQDLSPDQKDFASVYMASSTSITTVRWLQENDKERLARFRAETSENLERRVQSIVAFCKPEGYDATLTAQRDLFCIAMVFRERGHQVTSPISPDRTWDAHTIRWVNQIAGFVP